MEDQFVMLPITVLFDGRLKMNDKVVYSALRSYRDESKGNAVYPSRATVAEKLNCSTDTIDRSVKRLVKHEHLSYIRGSKGRANTYQFLDRHSRKMATMQASSSQPPDRLDAATNVAEVRPQPESGNHNKKPYAHTLFHGNETSYFTSSGSIKIINFDGRHLDYSGGDDERFRFGNLHGIEALKAARANHAKRM